MSKMVERVARAMAAADSGPEGSKLFEFHWAEFSEGYLSGAAIAIEAMRDLTEEMIVAGSHGNDPQEVWSAMIGAALADEGRNE